MVANYSGDVSGCDFGIPDSRTADVPDLVSREYMRRGYLHGEQRGTPGWRSIGKFATGREWSLQKDTLEVCPIRVERETQAQRAADRHEALKFPEATAEADRSVGVAENPFQKSEGFWAAIKGR